MTCTLWLAWVICSPLSGGQEVLHSSCSSSVSGSCPRGFTQTVNLSMASQVQQAWFKLSDQTYQRQSSSSSIMRDDYVIRGGSVWDHFYWWGDEEISLREAKQRNKVNLDSNFPYPWFHCQHCSPMEKGWTWLWQKPSLLQKINVDVNCLLTETWLLPWIKRDILCLRVFCRFSLSCD